MNSKKDNYKDHSLFTRWVNNLDDNDKSLTPPVRRRKWGFIVGFVLIIFVLSFIMFPKASITSEKLESSENNSVAQHDNTTTQSAFGLPVDSFENHLKLFLHERISKKE